MELLHLGIMETQQAKPLLFADSLSRIAKERKLSDRGIAKAMTDRGMEVSRDKVGAWRRGDRLPDLAEVDLLAKILEVDLWALAYGEEPDTTGSVDDDAFILRTVRALKIDADEVVRRLTLFSPLPDPPARKAGWLGPEADLTESVENRQREERRPKGKKPGKPKESAGK